MESSKYNDFYKTSFFTAFLRLIATTIFVSPTISSFLWVKKNNPFFVVLFGRNIWPAGFGGLAIYCGNKYIAIKLGLANMTDTSKTNIINDDS